MDDVFEILDSQEAGFPWRGVGAAEGSQWFVQARQESKKVHVKVNTDIEVLDKLHMSYADVSSRNR